ncbi:hypothetical protein GT370_00570 [Acidocella sp. MX-AZ03]|uniref:hypothetical protein n=1 Tax=Acidocella sp. MX-AZ03 TaxID=2697363 RepID=UPI0022DD0B03|nr:hypothetical protein [Acidocella sp. MX-AZ03]WBO59479.1 hypothetical protein GT370_00570 [Acidocella sp. MX-AZ03]
MLHGMQQQRHAAAADPAGDSDQDGHQGQFQGMPRRAAHGKILLVCGDALRDFETK